MGPDESVRCLQRLIYGLALTVIVCVNLELGMKDAPRLELGHIKPWKQGV